MKRLPVLVASVFFLLNANAQLESLRYTANAASQPEWVQLMYAPDPDPGVVQAAYDAYYATHPFEKNTHTQYFKRWKRELSHAYIPKDPQQRANYEAGLRDYLEASASDGSRTANWSCVGPVDWDHSAVDRSYAPGSAHVYTVEQSATNPDLLYAGTGTAGVWKSTDRGLNWTDVTKSLMVSSVVSVEIDHTVPGTVYFGSEGDLWKSTDGGTSWNSIGDASFQALNHRIADLVMHPTNNQILFVCSDQGLYRSTNAGASFVQLQSGVWQELEFKPNDTDTIYAIKQVSNRTEFWRSVNGGSVFSQLGTGWPNPVAPDEQKRTEIAVSPAAPNVVYALCSGAADSGTGLFGVYKSVDGGNNWSFRCCGTGPGGVPSPTNFNLLGYDDGGQSAGGQYYYDLAFAVSPTNADILHVCGIQRWVSTDGGLNFTCPAKWSHSYKANYLHADIHDIRYFGNEIWVASDGGMFQSTDDGTTFNRRMFGIAGTDFWGFGHGGWTGADVLVGGTYHNGTMLKDNNVYINGWVSTDGGDGVRGTVHPQYDRRVLTDYGYKTLSGDRTVANASTNWSKLPNASYVTGQSSDLLWHPNLVNTAYLGSGNSLWRTDDNGASFTPLFDFGVPVASLAMCFTDPNVIYACTFVDWWGVKRVFRSADAGVSFVEITPPSTMLGADSWVPYDIVVSTYDPMRIWLARTSQYGNYPNLNGNCVYTSANGGANWTNITDAALNNHWPTNITHQLGTNGGLYLGTSRAVFTRSDSSPNWALWNVGLPVRTYSTRLQLHYREGKIRNATDRSVWESALEATAPPVANFAADKRTVTCLAPMVQFWDNSALSGNGATWSWSFPGGSPSTATNRSPLVTYSAPGVYDVSLTVTDANGTHTRTITGFITYANSNAATPVSENAENQAVAPIGWMLENPDALETWGNVSVTGADGNATRAWRIDYYYYNAPGQVDRLVTPVITLGGSAGTRLKFHHAYKPYGASYTDGLRVEISTNCGANWTQLYYQEALALGTTTTGTSPWAPTAANQWLLHDIDLSAYDGRSVVVRFTGVNDYGDRLYLDNISVMNSGMRLALKLMLEGAFDSDIGKMRDDLRGVGILPALEPYTSLGFQQASDGGGEVMQAGVTSTLGDNAIVDWVQVELRSGTIPTTIVATRPALVQRDGDVVAEDGISPISLLATAGNYYVAVRHRNHLGAMTSAPLALSTAATTIDFTSLATSTHGMQALKTIGSVNALWMGDVVRGGGLKYTGSGNDRDPILVRVGSTTPNNTVIGYFPEDCTLNGSVRYTGSGNDRDPILVNVGSAVPTNVRVEQLP